MHKHIYTCVATSQKHERIVDGGREWEYFKVAFVESQLVPFAYNHKDRLVVGLKVLFVGWAVYKSDIISTLTLLAKCYTL